MLEKNDNLHKKNNLQLQPDSNSFSSELSDEKQICQIYDQIILVEFGIRTLIEIILLQSPLKGGQQRARILSDFLVHDRKQNKNYRHGKE